MTRKERLIEVALSYGIKNAADMTERQLRKEVAGLKSQEPGYKAPVKKTKTEISKKKAVSPTTSSTTTSLPTTSSVSFGIASVLRANFYQDMFGNWHWYIATNNGVVMLESDKSSKTRWGAKRAVKRALGL